MYEIEDINEKLMGIFYNFVINDPVIRLIIDKLCLKNTLMQDFNSFMLEYQTQFFHWLSSVFSLYKADLPSDLSHFEFDYLSIFFQDLSFFISNDYLPHKKTWFLEDWPKLNLFSTDRYLCTNCMSLSFRRQDGITEVVDHTQWIQQPELDIPEDLKGQIESNYLL
jgi:hypothetical protein